MQHRIVLGLSLLAVSFVASSATAQPVIPIYPVMPGYLAVLPPYEIVAAVRSLGLEPLSRPLRYGGMYGLRAVDPAGREVQVIADARDGRILRVNPVPPRFAAVAPPPYLPPGRMVPELPGARMVPEMPPPPGAAAPAGPAGTLSAPRAPVVTPLPRPRPKVAAVQAPAAPPPAVVAPQAAPPQVPTAPAAPKEEIKAGAPAGTAAPASVPEPPATELHE